jgi:hypothetical protein
MVAVHEGGYSELYVPFCGLAVIEQLARTKSQVRHWSGLANAPAPGGIFGTCYCRGGFVACCSTAALLVVTQQAA